MTESTTIESIPTSTTVHRQRQNDGDGRLKHNKQQQKQKQKEQKQHVDRKQSSQHEASIPQHHRQRRQQEVEGGESTSASTLSKIQQNTDYVPDVYEPPAVLKFIGTILDTKSGAGGTDALAFVGAAGSNDVTTREAQVQYVKSLAGLGSFFIVVSSLWFLALWLLKCQGRSKVGCAGGFAFHDRDSDSETIVEERRQRLAKDSADKKLQWGDDEDVSVGAAYDGGESVFEDAYPIEKETEGAAKESGSGSPRKALAMLACGLSDPSSNRDKNINVPHNAGDDVSMMTGDSINISQADSNIYRYDGDMSAIDGMLQSHGAPDDEDDRSDYIPRGRYSNQPRNVRQVRQQQQQQQQQTLRSIPRGPLKEKNNFTWDERSDEQNSSAASSSFPQQRVLTSSSDNPNSKTGRCFSGCCSWDPEHVRRRKNRTRFAYGFFSIAALVCSVLLMTVMYAPLEQSAMTTSSVVQEAKGIVDEVNGALDDINSAATVSQEILEEQIARDFAMLCPGVSTEEFNSAFGFDPDAIISSIETEYERYGSQATELLETAYTAVDQITGILEGVDGPVQKTNEYLWVVPLLICCTALVIFATLGLMSAVMCGERKVELKTDVPKIEDWYGWTFLPLLILACIVSWVLVILCCFGTVVTTDTCVSSTSPDETILAIVESRNLEEDIYRRLETYINGCQGDDPLQELVILQELLHETLGFVDERVQQVDEIGYEALEELCGPGNEVRAFFTDVKTLQREVVKVNEAIQSAYYALECPRINSLYNEVAHDALCTDFATANVNGFLLFLFGPAVSGLILISLRASWRTAAGV